MFIFYHSRLNNGYCSLNRALAEAEQSVVLNATEAQNQASWGHGLNCVGRPEDTLERMGAGQLLHDLFCRSRTSLFGSGGWRPHLGLAASYSELSQAEEARAEIAAVLKINPQFSLEGVWQRWPYQDPADLERLLIALRKAGLE